MRKLKIFAATALLTILFSDYAFADMALPGPMLSDFALPSVAAGGVVLAVALIIRSIKRRK